MKPVHRIIIACLICLAVTVGAYIWTTRMLDSLYAFRSPLKNRPPAPGELLGAPAARRVVFVLVDALRYDTAMNTEVMPTLAKLRESGAAAVMHSRTPSFSQPGYSTLLTGAWPDVNDGPAMNLEYAQIPTWTQDNLFSATARAGLKTAVSGYYWFEKLIPQDAVTAHFYTPDEDAAADRAVVDAALPWLANPPVYQFILIHLDQVDYAGHHEGGPRSANWAAAARRSDALISEILNRLDMSKDAILVASDHGQIDRGGHGGQEAVTLVEPFVLAGAGVAPGRYSDIQMVDLAPTIAALLGLNLPASSQGQVRTEMLALPSNISVKLLDAAAAQQEQMVSAYAAAIGQRLLQPRKLDASGWQFALERARGSRLLRERLSRAVVALFALFIISLLINHLRAGRTGRLVAGVLIYLLVFNLRYAVLDGLTYSFSTVPGATAMIVYCGVTSAAALLLGWVVYSWRGKPFVRRFIKQLTPSEAAEETFALVLSVIAVLALPALANFALNGPVVTWTLPEPASFFLSMLAQIQALFVAVVGLLLAGISALAVWLVQVSRPRTVAQPVKIADD